MRKMSKLVFCTPKQHDKPGRRDAVRRVSYNAFRILRRVLPFPRFGNRVATDRGGHNLTRAKLTAPGVFLKRRLQGRFRNVPRIIVIVEAATTATTSRASSCSKPASMNAVRSSSLKQPRCSISVLASLERAAYRLFAGNCRTRMA